ncbi:MAG: hypothetical protein Q9225_002783 [Loekoesia sp. 1 TL-2023]
MASIRYPVFRTGPRILAPRERLPICSITHTAIRAHTTYHWSSHVKSPRDQERTRPFHESEKQQWRFDTSSIDFAYMPKHTLEEATPPEVMRIPLLPHNFLPPRTDQGLEEAVDNVVRPEISTVSANSTHIESPSAMSEVTDNDAIDLDPYDLTNKVMAAATKTAKDTTGQISREAGTVRQLWSGLLDDIFGSRRVSRA